MNMNKILAAGLIGAVASTASFSECGNGGFYVGANLGLAFNKTKIKASKTNFGNKAKMSGTDTAEGRAAIYNTTSESIAKAASMNKKKTKFMAELVLGYDFRLGDVMMGVDLTFGTMFGKQKLNGDSYTLSTAAGTAAEKKETVSYLKLKQQWAVGLMPRIGYLFTPEFEGYVTAGMKFARWKATTIKYAADGIEDKLWAEEKKDMYNSSVNKSKMKVQPVIGAGVRYEFMPSMFAKLEYNLEFKAKPKLHGKTMPELNKVETKAHVFKLGLGYRF